MKELPGPEEEPQQFAAESGAFEAELPQADGNPSELQGEMLHWQRNTLPNDVFDLPEDDREEPTPEPPEPFRVIFNLDHLGTVATQALGDAEDTRPSPDASKDSDETPYAEGSEMPQQIPEVPIMRSEGGEFSIPNEVDREKEVVSENAATPEVNANDALTALARELAAPRPGPEWRLPEQITHEQWWLLDMQTRHAQTMEATGIARKARELVGLRDLTNLSRPMITTHGDESERSLEVRIRFETPQVNETGTITKGHRYVPVARLFSDGNYLTNGHFTLDEAYILTAMASGLVEARELGVLPHLREDLASIRNPGTGLSVESA